MAVHNIILIGSTGVGKTSTGFELAHHLNLGFFDTDHYIAKQKKTSITKIFEDLGEEEFRAAEVLCCAQLSTAKSQVIATGAGFVAHHDNLLKLKEIGFVIWLRVPASQVATRLLSEKQLIEQRPLLKEVLNIKDVKSRQQELTMRLQALAEQRYEFYRQADIEVDGSFLTQSTLVKSIAEKIAEKTAHTPKAPAHV